MATGSVTTAVGHVASGRACPARITVLRPVATGRQIVETVAAASSAGTTVRPSLGVVALGRPEAGLAGHVRVRASEDHGRVRALVDRARGQASGDRALLRV